VAETLQAAMTEHELSGTALGILFDGREEYGAFGIETAAIQAPVSTDTLFPVGSVPKPHTATAIMHVVSDRRLNLDVTIRIYQPAPHLSDSDLAERVTLRLLLTHTGGWFSDAIPDLAPNDDQLGRFVDEAMPSIPPWVRLGARISVNNTGGLLLGRLIEAVAGQPNRAAMRELLLAPRSHHSGAHRRGPAPGAERPIRPEHRDHQA
jgi:CubicO group peptidase (beta-lactamase class C family)